MQEPQCLVFGPFRLDLRDERLWRGAAAYGNIGQTAEGLNVLAEALAFAHTTGKRCWEAELYRLKGELLLQSGVQGLESGVLTPDAGFQTRDTEAEACLRHALEIAHRQQI